MLDRLGNVLYGIGCIVAALVLAFGGLVVWTDLGYGRPVLSSAIMFAVLAVIPWAIGWAVRYVLAGKR
jgi:hypothetical protein